MRRIIQNHLLYNFNPRAPRGARLRQKVRHGLLLLFQSTCPARGTTTPTVIVDFTALISIHVPREGHDHKRICFSRTDRAISIHVPREGHDAIRSCRPRSGVTFQSTCPARGTTTITIPKHPQAEISIHVPREGHDNFIASKSDKVRRFQSTCPARGTTKATTITNFTSIDFNPRAPRGARQSQQSDDLHREQFQSTCPARGTTPTIPAATLPMAISIHVPREGHDFSFFSINLIA